MAPTEEPAKAKKGKKEADPEEEINIEDIPF
jgi:hypothetical protein